MSYWFILFIYTVACYGITYMVTQSAGPKNIFIRLRLWADNIGPNFGMLFHCPLCFPCNIGWILSILNWFILPDFAITPFNMIFLHMHEQWWLVLVAMIGDCCYTGGICKVIYNVDDYIDKSTPKFEDDVPSYYKGEEVDNMMDAIGQNIAYINNELKKIMNEVDTINKEKEKKQ